MDGRRMAILRSTVARRSGAAARHRPLLRKAVLHLGEQLPAWMAIDEALEILPIALDPHHVGAPIENLNPIQGAQLVDARVTIRGLAHAENETLCRWFAHGWILDDQPHSLEGRIETEGLGTLDCQALDFPGAARVAGHDEAAATACPILRSSRHLSS
jgi:hypothetical protein